MCVETERPPDILAGFNNRAGSVWFDNADCTGAAWIDANQAVQSVYFDEFSSAFFVGDEAIDPDERRLYVPTTDISELRTVNSVMQEKCDPTTQMRQFVPAALLDADLHTTFPKPYTLKLN